MARKSVLNLGFFKDFADWQSQNMSP